MAKISLSPITIKQADFEEAFGIAYRTGYSGIVLRYDELRKYIKQGHSLTDVIDLSRKYNLEFTEMNFLAEWEGWEGIPLICQRRAEKEMIRSRAEHAEELELFFDTCKKLGCRYVPLVAAIETTGSLEKSTEDFSKLCRLAAKYGINVCLEFMGHSNQINSINVAWEVVKKTKYDNAGITFDTFHFYERSSSLEDLEQVPQEKIMLVHVTDARKGVPREKLSSLTDRLLPGEGVIPLEDIIKALRNKRYDGFYTLEVLNEAYWRQSSLEIARKGYEAVLSLLEK